MTKPIVISVAGEPQGVVVPNGAEYRFMAVKLGVFPLDGQIFDSIEAARAAAQAVMQAADSSESGPDEDLVA